MLMVIVLRRWDRDTVQECTQGRFPGTQIVDWSGTLSSHTGCIRTVACKVPSCRSPANANGPGAGVCLHWFAPYLWRILISAAPNTP